MASNDKARSRKLLILVVSRFCLATSLILIGFFAHGALQDALINFALGVWLLAGILIFVVVGKRYLDWETTPLLLGNIVLLVAVMVPGLAESVYVLGFVLALWLTSCGAWIVRKLKGSGRRNDDTSPAEV